MLYAENARSFLFKRNTDIELDLSNDRELSYRADFAEYIPLQEMLQKAKRRYFGAPIGAVGSSDCLYGRCGTIDFAFTNIARRSDPQFSAW